jgi:Na+/H+-dicarboxylate symporter
MEEWVGGDVLVVISILAVVGVSAYCSIERKRYVKARFMDILGETLFRIIWDFIIAIAGVFILGFITSFTLYPFLEIIFGASLGLDIHGAVRTAIMAFVIYRRETKWKRP